MTSIRWTGWTLSREQVKDSSLTFKTLISKFEPKPRDVKTCFELKWISLCFICFGDTLNLPDTSTLPGGPCSPFSPLKAANKDFLIRNYRDQSFKIKVFLITVCRHGHSSSDPITWRHWGISHVNRWSNDAVCFPSFLYDIAFIPVWSTTEYHHLRANINIFSLPLQGNERRNQYKWHTWKMPPEVLIPLKPQPYMLVSDVRLSPKIIQRCFQIRSTHSDSVDGSRSSWWSRGARGTGRTLENRDQSNKHNKNEAKGERKREWR